MNLQDIERELRIFKKRSSEKIKYLFRHLNNLKTQFVTDDNQLLAKQVWIYKIILSIQCFYLDAYDKLEYAFIYNKWIELTISKGNRFLRSSEFHKAYQCLGPNLRTHKSRRDDLYISSWTDLIDGEKWLQFLRIHLDYEENNKDIYSLCLISNQIEKLQIIFPFKLFMSSGMTISEKTCNICGKRIRSPRTDCKHINYEIYDGEMCFKRPSNCEEIHHVAMTPYPRDKACVIYAPEGRHYSYKSLNYLLSIHPSPFNKIEYRWINRIKKNWDNILNLPDNNISIVGLIELLLEPSSFI